MPIKKIDYLQVDGKECCRCGVPFYRITNLVVSDVPEAPVTSPLILRNTHNDLSWQWINRSDMQLMCKSRRIGWTLQRVDPTPDGVFCRSCSKRDDRWMGIEGRPHIVETKP